MTYHGDIALGATIDIKFSTRQFSDGVPTLLTGTPAVVAYPDNSTTEITAGITLSTNFDSRAGLNNVRIVATSGNGYAAATNYVLVISAGTVGGTSVVGEVVGSFSIAARVDQIADAVWDEAKAGHTGATTFGDIPTDLDQTLTDVATVQSSVDGLNDPSATVIRDAILPVKNVAFSDIPVFMVDSTTKDPKTGLTLGVTRSIDGAAFGAGTGTAAEISDGHYQYDASAADMNGTIIVFRFTGTGADDTSVVIRTGG